jgi:predicted MFS family arabinose efflux permease
VIGGFSGRFFAGLAGAHCGWRWALALTALLNAIAGLVVMASLPARPATRRSPSGEILRFLVDPRFQAAFLSGFNALFSLVALFTYVTFYLAEAPFHLGPAALGSIFCVYLVGMFITPMVGLVMGRLGFRLTLMMAALAGGIGAALTLAPSLVVVMVGLAVASSGAFVSQAATSGYITTISGEQRTTALGLYLGFYYLGGSAGAALPGFLWQTGGWPACVALLMMVQGATWFTVRFGFQRSAGFQAAA